MFAYVRSIAAAAALAAVAAPQASAQATLDLDVDFNFPALVLLRCVDDLTLTLSAETLLAAAGVSSTTNTVAAGTDLEEQGAGIFQATGAEIPSTSFTNLPITVNSICSIRAIGAGSTVNVNLTLNTQTLSGPADQGSIFVQDLLGRDGGSGVQGADAAGAFVSHTTAPQGAAGGDFDVGVAGGFGTIAYVDVRFDLDLSDASEAGDYQTAGVDLFTIEVNAQ